MAAPAHNVTPDLQAHTVRPLPALQESTNTMMRHSPALIAQVESSTASMEVYLKLTALTVSLTQPQTLSELNA